MTVALVIALILVAGLLWYEMRRRRQLEADLESMQRARVDVSTSLPNRAAFRDDLELEVLRASRNGRPACLALLAPLPGSPATSPPGTEADAEAWSHAVVASLAVSMRVIDLSYRLVIDEFALIMPDTRARSGVLALQRVEQELDKRGVAGGLRAGLAEFGPGLDRHQLFRHAYCALLAGGRDGRGHVLVYGPELERGGGAPGLGLDTVGA